MLYLSDAEVGDALRWDELIPAMEDALASLSSGRVLQPPRSWLPIEEGKRFWGVMPAAAQEAMGIKLVSFYPQNAELDLPTVSATVVLFRPETGELLAVMDANTLTAMRTAAVSAAVTRRLSRPDAKVLALLGSGVQAASHLAALTHVRDFEEVRVWSRTPQHAERFAERHGARAMDAESAVRGADVIVTATPSRTPILRGSWLERGAHVNAIGAPMPAWRELDDEAMGNTIVVESRATARAESGDVILSGASIHAEIGEIFSGETSIRASETTIFKSLGVAIEDVAAARLVFDVVSRRRSAPPAVD